VVWNVRSIVLGSREQSTSNGRRPEPKSAGASNLVSNQGTTSKGVLSPVTQNSRLPKKLRETVDQTESHH